MFVFIGTRGNERMDKRETLNSGNYFNMFDKLVMMFKAQIPALKLSFLNTQRHRSLMEKVRAV